MATALLGQAGEDDWTAYVRLGDSMVQGQGATMLLAKADLLDAVEFLNASYVVKGRAVPEAHKAEIDFKIFKPWVKQAAC
jgi:hypothetical protein